MEAKDINTSEFSLEQKQKFDSVVSANFPEFDRRNNKINAIKDLGATGLFSIDEISKILDASGVLGELAIPDEIATEAYNSAVAA